MSLLAPLALLGGLLALPIIALYFLRQRRRPLPVSSLLLWQRALEDRAANAWWQRFQRHLLLWAQLVALASIVLALARPALPQASAVSGRSVFLIDVSASMGARQGSTTRWQSALDEARRLLSTLDMGAGDEALLVAVDDQARPLTARSADLALLNAALDAASAQTPLRPAAQDAWQSAFSLVQAEAQGASAAFRWFILSDGGLPDELALPANLPAPQFITIGQDAPNLAISALALRPQGQQVRAFLRVVNEGPLPAEARVTLRLDGRLWDAQTLALPAQSAQSLSLSLERSFQTLSASLSADSQFNALEADDSAYAVAPQVGAARVLIVSDGRASDRFVEQALIVVGGAQVFRASPNALPTTSFDLTIFNGVTPSAWPAGSLWLIDPPLAEDAQPGFVGLRAAAPDHPLLAFADLSGVAVREWHTPSLSPAWQRAALLSAPDGGAPLVVAQRPAAEGGGRVLAQGFALEASDWPLNAAFPIVVANLLQWASPAPLLEPPQAQVGQVVTLNLPPASLSAALLPPDGQEVALSLDDAPRALVADALGLYRLMAETPQGQRQAWLAVNLFAPQESDLRTRQPDWASASPSGTAADQAEEGLAWRELWPVAALLALLALALEWWLYVSSLRLTQR
ncbi:MAG: BatA and WFA domain-containing protein [Anaerolineae bacterium]|nr:BatA and WFA domain-containing protein [Anaerolineae bacterium]MDW8172674.1 BatA and WFA domain-containing protein [Anaerolineae bacterium]